MERREGAEGKGGGRLCPLLQEFLRAPMIGLFVCEHCKKNNFLKSPLVVWHQVQKLNVSGIICMLVCGFWADYPCVLLMSLIF